MTQLFENNATTTLSGSITDVATTIPITAETNGVIPTPTGSDYIMCTLSNAGETVFEIIKVTSRSGNNLTATRGQEGTTAIAWASGSKIQARITQATLERFVQNGATSATAIAIKDTSTANTAGSVAIGSAAFSGVAADRANTTAYTFNDVIAEAGTDRYYVCYSGGTTAGAPPAFNHVKEGDTTTDGTVTWSYIGTNTDAFNTDGIAIGTNAATTGGNGITLGFESTAGPSGISLGYQAVSALNGISIGTTAMTHAPDSLAIGEAAFISGTATVDCHAIGNYASVTTGSRVVALGPEAVGRISDTINIAGINIIRKDSGEAATDEHRYFSGMQVVIMSKEVDLKSLTDDIATIAIPTGASFYPDQLGVIVTSASAVGSQPSVSFGITGNTTALLASTATTKSAAKGRDVFTPISLDGVTSLTASVKTAATGTTLLGRFYFKGILIEDE